VRPRARRVSRTAAAPGSALAGERVEALDQRAHREDDAGPEGLLRELVEEGREEGGPVLRRHHPLDHRTHPREPQVLEGVEGLEFLVEEEGAGGGGVGGDAHRLALARGAAEEAPALLVLGRGVAVGERHREERRVAHHQQEARDAEQPARLPRRQRRLAGGGLGDGGGLGGGLRTLGHPEAPGERERGEGELRGPDAPSPTRAVCTAARKETLSRGRRISARGMRRRVSARRPSVRIGRQTPGSSRQTPGSRSSGRQITSSDPGQGSSERFRGPSGRFRGRRSWRRPASHRSRRGRPRRPPACARGRARPRGRRSRRG
jgi:hypothetical protein